MSVRKNGMADITHGDKNISVNSPDAIHLEYIRRADLEKYEEVLNFLACVDSLVIALCLRPFYISAARSP